MSERTLGIAIHGAGEVAGAHGASWGRQAGCQIVSITSRTTESARRLADRLGLTDCHVGNDYDAVLRDPRVDVVNLSGPNHVHFEQAMAAARAGKHLMIEKPMVLAPNENRRLRDEVARAGVKSIVSFVLRFNPLVENLRSLFGQGAIGDLFHIEVDYWHGIADWHRGWAWVRTKAQCGSAMLFGGCHAVDTLRFLAGKQVVEVTAYGNNIKQAFEYPANVVAILKLADGTIGKTSVMFDAIMPYSFVINMLGTEGTFRDNRLWSPERLFPKQTDWNELNTTRPDTGAVDRHPFDAQMALLVDAIRGGTDAHCDVADSFHTHEICLAIDRSVEEGGRPVRLPLED